MKETIKSAAHRTGLAEETIRKYERYGIIQPEKNEETGYRYFNSFDLSRLFSCKRLRQCGFGLDETSRLLSQEQLSVFQSSINEKKHQIEQEMLYQKILLKGMAAMQKDIACIERKSDCRQIRKMAKTHYFFIQSVRQPIVKKERKVIRALTDLMPVSVISMRYQYQNQQVSGEDNYGFMVPEEVFRISPHLDKADFIPIKPCNYATSIFCLTPHTTDINDPVNRLAEFAVLSGFSLSSECYLNTIITTGIGKGIKCYKRIILTLKDK